MTGDKAAAEIARLNVLVEEMLEGLAEFVRIFPVRVNEGELQFCKSMEVLIAKARHTVASAFDKGWADFRAGAYWRDNPFPDCSQDNADWSRGWCHAEARDSGSRARRKTCQVSD